jgi:tripartite-type tricarboxylate transporter receptor subunit TctC
MINKTVRQLFTLAAAALVGTACIPERAEAQSPADRFPSKPIKIVVPFAAAGSADILTRVVAQKMAESWGQPVIVENKPGASSIIGSLSVAKAAPDGYTLLVVVSNHITNPAIKTKLPYDTLKELQPISLLARTPVVVYSNPSFPAANLKELIEIAKSKPGTISFGSAGIGSMTHLTAEMLKLREGLDMSHIVYRGGAPALTDVLAGHIPLTFATVGQALPQYHAKQVRALGISSEKRYPSVPEIPTFKEQGIDIVSTEWYALLAPAGTPPAIIAKLNAEVRRILALPGLGERLTAIELISSTPEELDGFIRSEMKRWAPVIQKLGLKED